jgi:hypothetical protein
MATKYKITTFTGDNAADLPISIQIGGTKDVDPRWFTLDNSGRNDFEVNASDDFVINVSKDLGDIVNISIKGLNSDDYWQCDKIEITKQGVVRPDISRTTIFSIDTLIKSTLNWLADGIDKVPHVTLDPEEYKQILYTESTMIDNIEGRTQIIETIELHQETEGMVSADETNEATQEHSWFIQGGYNPPDLTGGVSFSAGYAGSVVSSVENATHNSHSEKITFTKKHEFAVEKGTCVILKVFYYESGRKGSVSMFGESLKIKQANSLSADIEVFGTYSNKEEIPKLNFKKHRSR